MLPKVGGMKTDVHAYLSDKLYEASEENVWKQAADGASYEGVVGAYLMPDTHSGYGVPVGSVFVTEDTIIQAGSGYDISCGVLYMKVKNLHASDIADKEKRAKWVAEIESRIATGAGSDRPSKAKKYSHRTVHDILRYGVKPLGISADLCERQYIEIPEELDLNKIEKAITKTVPQIGSVGGGNHFIEMQVDSASGDVWVMIHCGSRGYGWQIANYYFYRGAEVRGLPTNRREDAWLSINEPMGKEYWAYHNSAANYAIANRHIIVNGVQEALHEVYNTTASVYYEISHNLVQEETLVLPDGTHKKGFVHRKGATRAFPAGHPDLKGTKWESTGHPVLIPGCLAKGTRILMANGQYKNIENIQAGDEVINGNGIPAKVKVRYDRGKKQVISYRSNQFWQETFVTKDHKHLIGDYSKSSKYESIVKLLSRVDSDGNSKIKWMSPSEFPDDNFSMLLPLSIQFSKNNEKITILNKSYVPSYDLGYVFGFFLGDGHSQFAEKGRGQVNFYLGKHETNCLNKLQKALNVICDKSTIYYEKSIIHVVVHNKALAGFFSKFGKKADKHLPEKFFRTNLDYANGIIDGLIDSDGHFSSGTNKLTNTSSKIIELYCVLHHMVNGYFPSISVRPPSSGGLKNCNIKNCNTSYRVTSLKQQNKTSKYQLVKPIGLIKTRSFNSKSLKKHIKETYDLCLEGDEPSFIANNVIVHNSMYTGAAILFPKNGAYNSGCSVNHGSGRVLARGEAKRQLEVLQGDIDDEMATVKRNFNGVEVEGIIGNYTKTPLDECGSCYKDLDEVLNVLEENGIASVSNRLYPVANIKGVD